MDPYFYVKQATDNGESLLSLCCGIGLELEALNTTDVTAVDIVPEYLEQVHSRCPNAKLVCSNAKDYVNKQPTKNVDVISLIDAIEHMTRNDGLLVLKHSKRVAKKQVLVFTPEGYVRNEPHGAWNIPVGDEYQLHKSGWEVKELEKLGFELIAKHPAVSQHNEPYNQLMFRYICSQS